MVNQLFYNFLNGLLVPSQGSVRVFDTLITSTSKNKDIRQIRKQVGLVFQFAENQIFEETVLKDVAFGPQNFGVSEEDAEQIAREKLDLVGLMNHFIIVVRLSYQVANEAWSPCRHTCHGTSHISLR